MGYVDLNAIDERHRQVHGDLVNWGRWARPRLGYATSPMFRMAVALARSREQDEAGIRPVDARAAERVEVVMRRLGGVKRRALAWYYVSQGPVAGALRACQCSDHTMLALLLSQAREDVRVFLTVDSHQGEACRIATA